MGISASMKRREMAFVRALLAGKTAHIAGSRLFRVENYSRSISLPKERVEILVSDGVVNCSENGIRANDLSKNWLKRRLASFDGSEEFASQHRKIKFDASGKKQNLNESVLSRLSYSYVGKAPYLNAIELEAGKRFAALYERAQLRSRISMNYEGLAGVSSGGMAFGKNDISDMAIDARSEIDKVLARLPKDCALVIVDVCGLEKGLQVIESERSLPARSAKLVLRIGLEQLAVIFGLSKGARFDLG